MDLQNTKILNDSAHNSSPDVLAAVSGILFVPAFICTMLFLFITLGNQATVGEDRELVTDEPVEVEK